MSAEPNSTICAIAAVNRLESKKRSDGPASFPAIAASTVVRSISALRAGAAVATLALVSGCANLIGSMAADTLAAAILNEDDPVLVESGVPAYLLLIDGLISQSPDNPDLLAAGAQIFALYGSRFTEDAGRSATLTAKAYDYGARSVCAAYAPACHWDGLSYDAFVSQLSEFNNKKIDYLYAFAVGWLAHLEATSEDWSAVAELPWVEAALERVLALDETYDDGALHAYLGIVNSLRPPALGGRPDVAKAHFERAIELSNGRDLSVKVEFARRYARLVFDQDLHDRLLREVIESPSQAPGYTLFNTMAKREAENLLATSPEYF
jgi:hypothetical protein